MALHNLSEITIGASATITCSLNMKNTFNHRHVFTSVVHTSGQSQRRVLGITDQLWNTNVKASKNIIKELL